MTTANQLRAAANQIRRNSMHYLIPLRQAIYIGGSHEERFHQLLRAKVMGICC